MIDLVKLTKGDVGRWVEYTPGHGAKERGRLKSWNEKFIFVVYKCDNEWKRFKDYTGAATWPKDLRFVESRFR